MNEMTPEEKDQALFSALLYSLHASGMQQLGKLANPMTGNVERDLTQAQYTIDMVDMLKRRTEGNRTDMETRLMSRVLAELQMNYVDEVKADQQGTSPGENAAAEESKKSDSPASDAKKGGTPEAGDGKTDTERSAN